MIGCSGRVWNGELTGLTRPFGNTFVDLLAATLVLDHTGQAAHGHRKIEQVNDLSIGIAFF